MTNFIDISKSSEKRNPTVFMSVLTDSGWTPSTRRPEEFETVVCLGKHISLGYLFAAYDKELDNVTIYKGIRGSEF